MRQRQYYDSVFLLATVLYFLSSDVFTLFTVSFLVFSNLVLFSPVFPGLKGIVGNVKGGGSGGWLLFEDSFGP